MADGGDGSRRLGEAVVALGSNLGNPLRRLREAAVALDAMAVVSRWSSLYRTRPVGGPSGQPDYLNGVAVLTLRPGWRHPAALLGALLAIERRQGRERGERWGPRTLDLDLLALDDVVQTSTGLTLPHPRMMARAFVLWPLCEVLPEWRHPVSGEAACAALDRVGSEGVHRTGLAWRPR